MDWTDAEIDSALGLSHADIFKEIDSYYDKPSPPKNVVAQAATAQSVRNNAGESLAAGSSSEGGSDLPRLHGTSSVVTTDFGERVAATDSRPAVTADQDSGMSMPQLPNTDASTNTAPVEEDVFDPALAKIYSMLRHINNLEADLETSATPHAKGGASSKLAVRPSTDVEKRSASSRPLNGDTPQATNATQVPSSGARSTLLAEMREEEDQDSDDAEAPPRLEINMDDEDKIYVVSKAKGIRASQRDIELQLNGAQASEYKSRPELKRQPTAKTNKNQAQHPFRDVEQQSVEKSEEESMSETMNEMQAKRRPAAKKSNKSAQSPRSDIKQQMEEASATMKVAQPKQKRKPATKEATKRARSPVPDLTAGRSKKNPRGQPTRVEEEGSPDELQGLPPKKNKVSALLAMQDDGNDGDDEDEDEEAAQSDSTIGFKTRGASRKKAAETKPESESAKPTGIEYEHTASPASSGGKGGDTDTAAAAPQTKKQTAAIQTSKHGERTAEDENAPKTAPTKNKRRPSDSGSTKAAPPSKKRKPARHAGTEDEPAAAAESPKTARRNNGRGPRHTVSKPEMKMLQESEMLSNFGKSFPSGKTRGQQQQQQAEMQKGPSDGVKERRRKS